MRSIQRNITFLVCTLLSHVLIAAEKVPTSKPISIGLTISAPLFDGSCGKSEWGAAQKIELPAGASIYLMHDKGSLFVCAKGKAEDYAVIDLYIENAETGHLHNLHASAQLSEKLLIDKEWGQPERWNLKDWGGFWVPYAGYEETEKGRRPKFLKGSHREIQVLRKKFSGNIWKMMISVSAINHEGDSQAFFFPEKAVDTDTSTWLTFSFSGA